MSYWFAVMAELADQKYPDQIAYLRSNYGFTQTHANALVMYSRGSKSTQRFNAITTKYPNLELVIAWNQPMLRRDGK